jgi:hypothetical protein
LEEWWKSFAGVMLVFHMAGDRKSFEPVSFPHVCKTCGKCGKPDMRGQVKKCR